MKNILVSDVMTQYPIIVSPDTNLLDCAKTMIKKKVGSLLLVDKTRKKKLVGFLAQKDILWALIKKSKEDLSKIKASDISPKKIAIIRPDATINDALNKMKKLKFEKLPVIQEGELVGIITIKDILTFNPEIYPEIEELSKIREESEKLKRIKKAKERIIEGICEECGNTDFLYRFNGMLICENCRNSL
ncbi:MAG: CBS domain-containing protein [Candidatus Pacearchaeota archaeon]